MQQEGEGQESTITDYRRLTGTLAVIDKPQNGDS